MGQVHYLTRACAVVSHNNDNGNIRDSGSQITNIIMMKNFEISPELPKYDTETSSEQTLLEKWSQSVDLLRAGLPQTFNLLKNKTKQKPTICEA